MKSGTLDTSTHTGRMPHEVEGADWDDVCSWEGTPKIASQPPETKKETWTHSAS